MVGREERCAHALSRLPPGCVGQTDHRVSRQAGRDVDFYADDAAVDAFQHCTVD
jgi:hypothetical protein